MIEFDVVIATYERHDSVKKLLNGIFSNSLLPKHIIIVDASNEPMQFDKYDDKIQYIRSSHANQPYQRYVGYLASKSEFIVYFDDDIRIEDQTIFKKIFDHFTEDIAGIQPAIDYPHTFFTETLPRSKSVKSKYFETLKLLTGVPRLETGEYWLCGLKGEKPKTNSFVEWFNGPVFVVRRELMYENFNFNLLNLYEMKLGKGEDSITGFTYVQQGKILYLSEAVFYHDPSYESTYTPNLVIFGKRYLFSRLYHSLEYSRLRQKNKYIAIMHYHWYSIWRIIGLIINQAINYKPSRTQLLKGYTKGWFLSIMKFDTINKLKSNSYWKDEAIHDIEE